MRYVLSNGEAFVFRKRGPTIPQDTEQEPCPSSLYLKLGSMTYVEMSVAEEQRRRHDAGREPLAGPEAERFRAEREDELEDRRMGMGYRSAEAYLNAVPDDDKDDDGVPYPETISCNLTLHETDRIFTRLRFAGPTSSNARVDCRCADDEPGQCARIVNPYTVSQMRAMHGEKKHGGEPVMMSFVPKNCGLSLIDGTGRYIDANGAINARCDPVTNVTINNCEIHGRIRAMSFSGNLALFSSPRADHVSRLQASAAQHLTFSNVEIRGKFRTPVHLLPGVHHVTVRDSTIVGGYAYSTVYLPVDGGWNTLFNNRIYGQSGRWSLVDITKPGGGRREVIAIDGSEHNRIVNNHIRRIPYGGIYMYRNCGERNMIRHRPPQYNQIINNVFEYDGRSPGHPAVFIGSRDDLPAAWYIGTKKYCDEDLGPGGAPYAGNDERFPWDTQVIPNSSESNDDWAGHNVVAQNQFVDYEGDSDFRLDDFIKLSSPARRLESNHLRANRTGTSSRFALDQQATRKAGCAVHVGVRKDYQPFIDVRNGYQPFIDHGETIDMFWDVSPPIRLTCGTPLLCTNNMLSETTSQTCNIRNLIDECQIEGANADCNASAACPEGHFLAGVQAACNLEYGAVADAQVDEVLMDRVRVVRPSGNVSDGLCWVNGAGISAGQRRIPRSSRRDSVKFGCRERDRNGGDCHARVRLYCREGAR